MEPSKPQMWASFVSLPGLIDQRLCKIGLRDKQAYLFIPDTCTHPMNQSTVSLRYSGSLSSLAAQWDACGDVQGKTQGNIWRGGIQATVRVRAGSRHSLFSRTNYLHAIKILYVVYLCLTVYLKLEKINMIYFLSILCHRRRRYRKKYFPIMFPSYVSSEN